MSDPALLTNHSEIIAFLLFGFAGALMLTGFHWLLWGGDPLLQHIDALISIWIGFFSLFFLCKVGRVSSLFKPTPIFWMIVLGVALLLRIQVMLAEPWLADDYQRYLFDGRLILAGINPYAEAPITFPEFGGTDIPKPGIKTIYPPLAEGLFAVTSWLGGTLWHWRLLNLIPDLLGATIFYRLLRCHQLPGFWVVLWLWNPLILKEGLHAAHLDIWTLFAVVLFIYWATIGHLTLAALALGAAVLIKLIPLVLLPAWLTQLPSLRERLRVARIVLLLIMFGFVWFLPWHPFGHLTVFLQHIEGYGVLFNSFQQGVGDWHLKADWSKWLLTSFGGALYLHWVFVLRRYASQNPSSLLELFIFFFIFSSMGFPWYLLAALPWMLIHGCWLWILFAALSQLIFYSHQLQASSKTLTSITLLVLILAIYQQILKTQKVKNYV